MDWRSNGGGSLNSAGVITDCDPPGSTGSFTESALPAEVVACVDADGEYTVPAENVQGGLPPTPP